MSKSLVYLAAPYSHKYERVRQGRYNRVNEIAAQLIEMGNYVFSPISHSHPILMSRTSLRETSHTREFDFWKEFDTRMLLACDEMVVALLDGWKESVGVRAEVLIAKEHKMKVSVTYPSPWPAAPHPLRLCPFSFIQDSYPELEWSSDA